MNNSEGEGGPNPVVGHNIYKHGMPLFIKRVQVGKLEGPDGWVGLAKIIGL